MIYVSGTRNFHKTANDMQLLGKKHSLNRTTLHKCQTIEPIKLLTAFRASTVETSVQRSSSRIFGKASVFEALELLFPRQFPSAFIFPYCFDPSLWLDICYSLSCGLQSRPATDRNHLPSGWPHKVLTITIYWKDPRALCHSNVRQRPSAASWAGLGYFQQTKASPLHTTGCTDDDGRRDKLL